MAAPRHNANGHRRRELTKRVWAEETHCALCNEWVDPNLTTLPGQHSPRCTRVGCDGCIPHPRRGEVDEDLPRSRGGSPYDRRNCHLLHRECNQFKSDMTLVEAKAKRTPKQKTVITTSPIW